MPGNARQAMRHCTCGRRAVLECDWPDESRSSGKCQMPICDACVRRLGDHPDKDFCPLHRGEPPMTQEQLSAAGAAEAANAARILGVRR